jgi:hypothetical protein
MGTRSVFDNNIHHTEWQALSAYYRLSKTTHPYHTTAYICVDLTVIAALYAKEEVASEIQETDKQTNKQTNKLQGLWTA